MAETLLYWINTETKLSKPIKNIEKVYCSSCELRFIDNWKLTKVYAKQGEFAEFEIGKEVQ